MTKRQPYPMATRRKAIESEVGHLTAAIAKGYCPRPSPSVCSTRKRRWPRYRRRRRSSPLVLRWRP